MTKAGSQRTSLERAEGAVSNSSFSASHLSKIIMWNRIWIMPMTLDQIVEETREMPGEVVAELVEVLG